MGKKGITVAVKKVIFCAVFIALSCRVFAAGDQESMKVLFKRGQKAFESKHYQKAIDYFEKVIELDNNFAPAYHALGLVYQQTSSDPTYPLWYFETAIEIDPDFAPSLDMLCRSYYQLQNFDAAEEMCRRALKKDPNLVGSELSLAWIYLLGKSDATEAIHYFERVQDKIKIPAVDFGLGMAYAINGEHAKVLEIITRLRAEGKEDFAVHLENMLRSQSDPQKFMPPNFREKQKEQQKRKKQYEEYQKKMKAAQMQGRQQVVPVPVPVVVRPKITGNPQIRIRGKIKPPQIKAVSGHSEPVTYGGQKEKHPGSLEDW